MAFKLTPPVFRREVQRRLMDVHEVQAHFKLKHKERVRERVKTGRLPAPVIVVPQGYALWDRDEIDNWSTTKEEP